MLYFDEDWTPRLVPLHNTSYLAPRFVLTPALRPVLARTGVAWRRRYARQLLWRLAGGLAVIAAVWPGVLLFTAVFTALFAK